MGSAEAAELTKLAETTYRDVNIALANEFARFADRNGIDIDGVIDAANSQPFSHIHRPGIAVGGHCIPVYPRFYLAGDPDARLPAASRAVNEGMPAYAVDLLERDLERKLGRGLAGARVLILGVTYRGDVKQTAFSGAFPVARELERRGASALAADPLYTDSELRALGLDALGWRSGRRGDRAGRPFGVPDPAAVRRVRSAGDPRRPGHRRPGAVDRRRRRRAADRPTLVH